MNAFRRRLLEIDQELSQTSDPRRVAELVMRRNTLLRTMREGEDGDESPAGPVNISATGSAEGEAATTIGDIAAGSIDKRTIINSDEAFRELVVRALADLHTRLAGLREDLQRQIAALATEQQARRAEQQARSDEMMASLRSSVSRALAGVDQRIDQVIEGLSSDAEERKARQRETDHRSLLIIRLLTTLCVLAAGVFVLLLAAVL